MNYGQPVVEWMHILEKQNLTFTNEDLCIKRVEKISVQCCITIKFQF
jgi:hypothetical protein